MAADAGLATSERRARAGAGGLPRVVHLGRTGEVPGGMVQVLNSYLRWPFERTAVEVLTTRGAPHDHLAAVRAAAGAAAALVRLPRPGVVVAHLSEGGSFVREGSMLRLASRRGLATVAHLHGASFAAFADAHPRLTGAVLRSADAVVVLSEESRAVSARFVPEDRVHLVPNAIPAGAPSPKRDRVVFGGVVSHRKGIDVLQEAWSQLDRRGWELVVAGPVPDASLLRRDLPGATFTGALPHAELMALLDSSRIAVLPSREEAMPMFLLEAMARGNAVVSTDVGGVAALLGRGRGVVVPPADPSALRDALEHLLHHPADVDALGAAARAGHAEGFSAEAVFPRVEALWLSALEGRGAR